MPSRCVKLNEEWLLRGWSDEPWMLVNWKNGRMCRLKEDGFYVAQSCDGKTDLNSMAFLPWHVRLLDKFIAEGIARDCVPGDMPEEIQKYRFADNPMIRGVHWAITGRCNMNCRFCFMEAPSGRYSNPDDKIVWDLIDQFEQANVLEVSLTGGEPLMRRDLMEIIGELTVRRIRLTEMVTNGTLITPSLLDTLKKLGQSPVFKISFDGLGVHDLIRGVQGTEALVKDNIRQVMGAGFFVVVTTTVDQDNSRALAVTYELMKNLGVPVWLIGRPQTTGDWCGSSTALSTEAMAEACLDLLQRWLSDGRPLHIMLEQFFGGGPCGPTAHTKDGWQKSFGPESYECNGVRSKPYLLPDGTLLPCTGYTGTVIHEKMPKLMEHPLSQIWRDSALRCLADMKKNEVLAHNPECGACKFFPKCGAGCRAYALTEADSLLDKDPFACAMWKGGYKKLFAETAAKTAAFKEY